MPIQRIPRYSLLLEDLLKNTWDDHIDYVAIQTAHQRVVDTTNYIDSCKAESDVLHQLTELQASLTGKFPQLVTVGRQLLKTGDVFINSGKSAEKKQPVRLYLLSDLILFTEPSHPKFKVKSYYYLTDITSVLSADKLGQTVFQIVTTTTMYSFSCEDERQKTLWFNLINKQLTIAREKQEQEQKKKQEQVDNTRSWSRNTDKAKEILLEAARAQGVQTPVASEPVPETGWARNTNKAKQLLLEAARLQMDAAGDTASSELLTNAMNNSNPNANIGSNAASSGSLGSASGFNIAIPVTTTSSASEDDEIVELRSPKKRNKLLDKTAWSKRLSSKLHTPGPG